MLDIDTESKNEGVGHKIPGSLKFTFLVYFTACHHFYVIPEGQLIVERSEIRL